MKQEDLRSDPIKFASLIAHQLQSPLSAVSTALQSVLAEYSGPLLPRQRGALEKANARCDQAITTIRRMLAIIRAREQQGAEFQTANLSEAMREIHAQMSSEAARRNIVLMLDLPDEGVSVRIANAAIAEVLSALTGNALKYTPDHGQIRIRAVKSGRPGMIAVSVADSGIGVPEQDRENIFQPFFRAASARASAQPGVGLGLAFVKSVITASGGSVRVGRSDLGGAEFVIELPVAELEAPARQQAPAGAPPLKVVIIGGVTAGPKAAAKIFRLKPNTDVTIVERGSVMSYAGCGLPYYVSGVVRDQKRLTSTPAGVVRDPVFFRNVMNVHVLNQAEAVEIDRKGKKVHVRDSMSRHETWLVYDKLLLATGASALITKALRTNLKNVFTLHGVRDAEGIKTALAESKASDVVIIGGGLIGIEMTEALVRKGARVTIVEQCPHIMPILDEDIAVLLERHLESNGVKILTNTRALSFSGEDTVTGVLTDKGPLVSNMVILAIGIRPNVELAANAGLDIGKTGAVKVNEFLQTSDPDIYAAGDCVENTNLITGKPCYVPLGSTASKHGRVAAINICGGKEKFPGIVASSAFRVFDFNVGRTGLGEEEARKAGYDAVSVLAPGPDRDHFMPTAGLILLKMTVDAKSRRLLGVQAAGPGAVDKRIDVAAMAISAGMTLEAVANADLGYAPSYSTAMDNIITAANIARNKLDGYMKGVMPSEVHRMIRNKEDFVLLDVRTPQEYEDGHLPTATLLPLGSLRGRLSDLPRDKDIITYCDISLRGYEAALILSSAGFQRVRVMEGGLAMWPYEKVE